MNTALAESSPRSRLDMISSEITAPGSAAQIPWWLHSEAQLLRERRLFVITPDEGTKMTLEQGWTHESSVELQISVGTNVDDMPDVHVLAPTTWECAAALEALPHSKACLVSADDLSDLTNAISAALCGAIFVSSRVAQLAACSPRLSSRTTAVLRLLLTGVSNRTIAEQLHLSLATVKREVTLLLQSFGVATRAALAHCAASAGAPARVVFAPSAYV